MSIDWSDAPEFGRTYTIKHTLDSLHLIKEKHNKDVVIVETGTTRGSLGGGVVGDGWATLAFGWYCKKYGGKVYTIDILQEAIEECKTITKEYESVIEYVVSDSVKYLKSLDETIDLLYLDSSDDPNIIMNELLAAYDKISGEALIIIDDTHDGMTRGKGVLACQHLLNNRWRLLLDKEGQVVFSNTSLIITPASFVPSDYSIDMYEYIQYSVEGERIKLRIEDYDEKAKTWQEVFFSWLPGKEVPKIDGVRKVLDLGTNTGYNAKLLEEIYGYAVGIDINENLIRYSKLNHDKCYVMSADDLRFDDESFSLVAAKDLIEHTLNPDGVIAEAYRVLIDDGYLVCMVPLDGELRGVDEISLHPIFSDGNVSHIWKATLNSVLIRIFGAGFTNVELGLIKHSELFSDKPRIYGDRVCVIRAQKKKDIIRVPTKWLIDNAFWAAFVTLTCTGNCTYCIQHFSKEEFSQARALYEKEKLEPEQWIDFYNRLQKYKVQPLSITGGEPLLYYGLFDLINSLDGYYKTVTTNLCAPAFDRFETDVTDEAKKMLRINTSFHPALDNVGSFCNKVHKLRDLGYRVDQVAMVDHPLSNFKYYTNEFLRRGIAISPQTYLGTISGTLLPSPDSDLIRDHKEHGINNFDIYNEGFSYKEKHDVLCMTRRFMVSPNGNIYNCHYHLYSNRVPLGNIKDGTLPEVADYEECSDYGFCNPCDFTHAKFRPVVLQLPEAIFGITQSEEMTKSIITLISNSKEFEEFVVGVSAELFSSSDIWWALYNNKKIQKQFNDFIKQGGFIDNSNALSLAKLEVNLFRCLPFGVNLYRLLDHEALSKYIDALGEVTLKTFSLVDNITSQLYNNELYKSFNTEVATILISLGMAYYDNSRIQFMRREI